MIIHLLATLVLFCSITTATVGKFTAFGEPIDSKNFSKDNIRNIINESLFLDSYYVKDYLKTFKHYRDPSVGPSSNIDLYNPFFKFLHPLYQEVCNETDTPWRKIFDKVLIEKSNFGLSSKNPLAHGLNFLSLCGILNKKYKGNITLATFNLHVSNLIRDNFEIPFSFSQENTYLKLIYCYFATCSKQKSQPARIFVESHEDQIMVGNHSNGNNESGSDIVPNPSSMAGHQRFPKIQWEEYDINIQYENSYNKKRKHSISEEIPADSLTPSSNHNNEENPIYPISKEEDISKMNIRTLLNR
jgi:hypothetical protein